MRGAWSSAAAPAPRPASAALPSGSGIIAAPPGFSSGRAGVPSGVESAGPAGPTSFSEILRATGRRRSSAPELPQSLLLDPSLAAGGGSDSTWGATGEAGGDPWGTYLGLSSASGAIVPPVSAGSTSDMSEGPVPTSRRGRRRSSAPNIVPFAQAYGFFGSPMILDDASAGISGRTGGGVFMHDGGSTRMYSQADDVEEEEKDDKDIEPMELEGYGRSKNLGRRRRSSAPDFLIEGIEALVSEDYPQAPTGRRLSHSRSKSFEKPERNPWTALAGDEYSEKGFSGASLEGYESQSQKSAGRRKTIRKTPGAGTAPKISSTPAGVEEATLPGFWKYEFLEQSSLSPDVYHLLHIEGCAACGTQSVNPEESACLIRCRKLGCSHVIHNSCLLSPAVKDILRTHSTVLFVNRLPTTKYPSLSLTRTEDPFHFEIQVFHVLGSQILKSFSSPKGLRPVVDDGAALVLFEVPKTELELTSLRAKIQFNGYFGDKAFVMEGNYDLTGPTMQGVDAVELVLIDQSQNSLALSVRRSGESQWLVHFVEVELGASIPLKLCKFPKELSAPTPMESKPIIAPRLVSGPSSIPSSEPVMSRLESDSKTMSSLTSSLPIPILSAASSTLSWDDDMKIESPSEEDMGLAAPPNPAIAGVLSDIERILQPTTDGSVRNSEKLLPQVLGNVRELAKTQCGSRFLQERIRDGDAAYMSMIYPEVYEHLPELMTDLFGNYLCQRLIRKCEPPQRLELLKRLSANMVEISCDRQGTRVMQKIIQYSVSEEEQNVIIEALRPSVLKMMFDPHGSYVVNALIDHVPIPKLRFVLAVAEVNCTNLAINQHGLCVLKKCMSKATRDEVSKLTSEIFRNIKDLVNNQYGNYLIQHLLTLGDKDVCTALFGCLRGSFCELSKQKFSSNVVEKSMLSAPVEVKEAIITELMNPDEIGNLLQDSYGNYVMQNALNIAEGQQAVDLICVIRPVLKVLRKKIQKKWERLLKNAALRVCKTEDLDQVTRVSSTVSSSPTAGKEGGGSPPFKKVYVAKHRAGPAAGGFDKGPVPTWSAPADSVSKRLRYAKG